MFAQSKFVFIIVALLLTQAGCGLRAVEDSLSSSNEDTKFSPTVAPRLAQQATAIGQSYNCPLPSGSGYNAGNVGYSFISDENIYATAKLVVEKNCFPPVAGKTIERTVTFYVSSVNFPSDGVPSGNGADAEIKWLAYWDLQARRYTNLGFKIILHPIPFIINMQPQNDTKPGLRLLRKTDLNISPAQVPEVFQCRDGRKTVIASIYDPNTLSMGIVFYQALKNFFGKYSAVYKVSIAPPSDFGEYGFPFGVVGTFRGVGVAWWTGGHNVSDCYKTGDIYARARIPHDPPAPEQYAGELNQFRETLTSVVKQIFPGYRYMLYLGFAHDRNPVDGFNYIEATQFAVNNGIDVHSSHLCGTSYFDPVVNAISSAIPAGYPFTFENCGELGEFEMLKNQVYASRYRSTSSEIYGAGISEAFFTLGLSYSTGPVPAGSLVQDKEMSIQDVGGLAALRSAHLTAGYIDAPRSGSIINSDAQNGIYGWSYFDTYGDSHNYGVLVYAGHLSEGVTLSQDQTDDRQVKGLHPQYMRLVASTVTQSERSPGNGDKSRFALGWKPNLASGKGVVRVYLVNGAAEIVAEHPDSPMVVEFQSRINGSFKVDRPNYFADNCSRSFRVNGTATNSARPGSAVDIVIMDETRGEVVYEGRTDQDGNFDFNVHISALGNNATRFVNFRAYAYADTDGDSSPELVGLPWNLNDLGATVGRSVQSNLFWTLLDCYDFDTVKPLPPPPPPPPPPPVPTAQANLSKLQFRAGSSAEVLAPLFDEQFYRQTYPDIAAAVANGSFASGLQHYILYGGREGRVPNRWFNEASYLAHNPDVANAVHGERSLASGFEHYLRYGARENRTVVAGFNEQLYMTAYSDVYNAVLNSPTSLFSGYHHWVLAGQSEGRSGAP